MSPSSDESLSSPYSLITSTDGLLLCKCKRQWLLTWKVSNHCLLALHGRIQSAFSSSSLRYVPGCIGRAPTWSIARRTLKAQIFSAQKWRWLSNVGPKGKFYCPVTVAWHVEKFFSWNISIVYAMAYVWRMAYSPQKFNIFHTSPNLMVKPVRQRLDVNTLYHSDQCHLVNQDLVNANI